MPAWSVPRIQSVLLPRIRFIRTSASCIEPFSAWPMCRAPVTFGGGIATEKFSSGVALRLGVEVAALDPFGEDPRLDLAGS